MFPSFSKCGNSSRILKDETSAQTVARVSIARTQQRRPAMYSLENRHSQCTETAQGQLTQVATREVAMRCQETNIHGEGGQTLEQVPRRTCGTSVPGDTWTCPHKLPASSLALSRGLDQVAGLLS